jgi:hypothetical protein
MTPGKRVNAPLVSAPHRVLANPPVLERLRRRDVALQVEFERQTLKPVFHLIGYRLWF